jgi:N6-adenosine-specific RNA methylase IME4
MQGAFHRRAEVEWAMKYPTIVADPPWKYQKMVQPERTTATRQAEHEYPTLSMRQIAALPVKDLAEDDAHLYLWVTVPRLFGDRGDRSFTPLDVMEAWGFEFKTMLTWVKPSPGLGWYFRGQTEHILFGVRGHPAIRTEAVGRVSNVLTAPRGRGHSAKPEAFLDLVERVSPGPYLELFARRNRLGWDTWGNESLEHVSL